MEKIQVVSVNVRGLNTTEKRTKIYDWLRDTMVDVVFLQETHFVEKYETVYNSRWMGQSFHCCSDSTFSRGVSILFRKDVPIEILNSHRSIDGRKILLNVKYEENIITLVNIYAPNNEQQRLEFFKKVKTFIYHHSMNVENVLLCGDFNCCNGRSDKSYLKLSQIVKELKMKDLLMNIHKDLNGYTWCDSENVPRSRIDYIYISENFVYGADKIILRNVPGTVNGKRLTDHRLFKFYLNLCDRKRGTGYWKLNTSHIENVDYKQGIRDIVNNCNLDQTETAMDRWELFKHRVKDFSIYYAKTYNRNIKKRIQYIEKVFLI